MALEEDKTMASSSGQIPQTPPPKVKKRKRKKKRDPKQYLNKNALSVLRTTLRNNIELTSIADNKANVLLSLNALMLTFLGPLTIPYLDRILALNLGWSLTLLAITCLVTIYLAVDVLRPGKFSNQAIKREGMNDQVSPFFFGNFLNMKKADFLDYSSEVLSDEHLVKANITNDFYHIGLRLAQKMKTTRLAFNIFIIGMTGSITLAIVMLVIYR